jgi:fused signal recognition particle receptor
MFGFLKDKLKGALGKLSKEVEKEAVIEKKEILVEKKPQKEDSPKKPKAEKILINDVKKSDEIIVIPTEKKKGFFQRIFGSKDEEEIIASKEELIENAERIEIETPDNTLEDGKKDIITEEIKDIKRVEANKNKLQTITEPEIIKKEAIEQGITEKEVEEELIIKEVIKPVIAEKEIEIPIIETVSKIESEKTIPVIKERIKESSTKNIKATQKPNYQTVEEKRENKVVDKKEEEQKGFFTKITETFTKIQITEDKFEELFWDLEVVLLENNVAVEVIDKIKRDLKKELMAGKVSRKGVDELIMSTLRQSIIELFDVENIDLIKNIHIKKKEGKPYIISIIGVNGSGKTTSIAKLTHKFQKEGFSVVLAASDTFRAAAIQQLEEHANRLNVKMVKHEYNSDPAAVAFDAIKYAEARNVDIVLIDTAGRLHSNTNLMRELEKVIRVCKPDIKIFVGESITGNDCVEQAKEFDKAVGIDAIILAKADVDDKGGAAISVSYILQRPILYLGTGQNYDDLKEFDSNIIIDSIGL